MPTSSSRSGHGGGRCDPAMSLSPCSFSWRRSALRAHQQRMDYPRVHLPHRVRSHRPPQTAGPQESLKRRSRPGLRRAILGLLGRTSSRLRSKPLKDAQKPDHVSLITLIGRIKEGRFVIPDFQREFMWDPRDIRDLMRSIFLDYYIGSLQSCDRPVSTLLPLLRKSAAVLKFSLPGLPRTVSAAIDRAVGLDTMSHDLAPTVRAFRRHCVDRAFKAVELTRLTIRGSDPKGLVVVVSANLAARHNSPASLLLRP